MDIYALQLGPYIKQVSIFSLNLSFKNGNRVDLKRLSEWIV